MMIAPILGFVLSLGPGLASGETPGADPVVVIDVRGTRRSFPTSELTRELVRRCEHRLETHDSSLRLADARPLLAKLVGKEVLVEISYRKPQTFAVAYGRILEVDRITIPVTGEWAVAATAMFTKLEADDDLRVYYRIDRDTADLRDLVRQLGIPLD